MNRLRSVTAVSAALLLASSAWAEGACEHPQQMDGFKTCVDVAAAEK